MSIAVLLLLAAHGWRNNNMMAYVEKMRIMEQDNAQNSIGMHQR